MDWPDRRALIEGSGVTVKHYLAGVLGVSGDGAEIRPFIKLTGSIMGKKPDHKFPREVG